MDYTTQPLWFKAKKALRYIRLYGLGRTAVKIRSHYHMNRRYPALPAIAPRPASRAHVGIIGCGKFAYGNIAHYVTRDFGRVIRGVMDRQIDRAASLCVDFGADYYTDDPKRILDDPGIDLVYIASNHASHADYAIAALNRGKCVHIEKPHVVNTDQLVELCAAMEETGGKVRLGFNRPASRLGSAIKASLDAESGPVMFNWFIAGHEIAADHWYFSKEEGGRILGNLCHWTDFVYQMVAPELRYPITINPTRSEKSDCDIAVSYVFGDGSIAALTFSAKGHTFEGVTEHLAAHRGNTLLFMDDFSHLVVNVVDKRQTVRLRARDHGHRGAIRRSYELTRPGRDPATPCSVEYVWETAELFLKTKQALEEDRRLVVGPYRQSCRDSATGQMVAIRS
jgi:predicted dehydrogenase